MPSTSTDASTGATVTVPDPVVVEGDQPSNPALYAVAKLVISPGDISGIGVNSRFSAALYLDVGNYLVFFSDTQPDTNYLAKAYDDASRVRVTEATEDYIAITATDDAGTPVDPAEVSVEIIRVG